MPLPGQGKRIEKLIFELTAALGRRVTLAVFGEMVGKAEKGRGKPYAATSVSEWIAERNEPSFAAAMAMSAVSRKHAPPGHSFTWIATGAEEGESEAEQLRPTPVKRVNAAAEKKRRGA